MVGSCLATKDFRDVDIRLILEDSEFYRLFPWQPPDPRGKMNDPHWELICNSISEWMRLRTGLPIDFQVQQMTAANATYDGPRHAMGFPNLRHRSEDGSERFPKEAA